MMRSLLLKQVDTLCNEDLNDLFCRVFDLPELDFASGAHDSTLLALIVDHAIKVELDRTTTKGCIEVEVTLTPRSKRVLFGELRGIYYQGLGVEMRQPRPWWVLSPVTKRGAEVAPTLMRALLTLAFRDAFGER